METAISRLRELPETDQAFLAEQINDYLTKLENVREMVREGLESGTATPLDMNAIIEQGQQRLADLRKNAS
ncbi:MAG: hypothetical protein AAGI08_05485 [Bacteroidota bacterium]